MSDTTDACAVESNRPPLARGVSFDGAGDATVSRRAPRLPDGNTPERSESRHARLLWQYLLLTYPLVLVNLAGYLRGIEYSGRLTPFFVAAVYLTYGLIYLLPAFVLLLALDGLLALGVSRRLLGRARIRASWIVIAAAVLAFGTVQTVLYADRFIFRMYGFHLNGFVWNLLTTRGGIESLGGENATTVYFSLIIAAIVAAHAVLMAVLLRWGRLRAWLGCFCSRRAIAIIAILAFLVGAFERFTYGVCSFRGYTPVLLASDALPFYQPTTFATLARSLGFKSKRDSSLKMSVKSSGLQYPLKPLVREPVKQPYNIIFLVAESLREDMLDPEIMPQTWELAHQANWFRQHYSGGNGTRMAMFSLFYGLYGSYWFAFLDQNRGPVLIDTLIDQNYQMKMFTSARFTYPEFDRTLFARISPDKLHEGDAQPKWRRDVENVDLMLDFMKTRDPSRPFMTFMFFESAHAKYYFPQESIIRKPYAEDLNYATMDTARDHELIKNRYINACRHLDLQFERVYKFLRERGLMESTIILITGDHGEEFMEKGHWGHASTFNEEQTRVPMVIWVPGKPRREVAAMTSHLDIAPTLLPLLGVTNPPEDYSLGYNLLGPGTRTYTVLCDWNQIAYVDSEYKAVFPINTSGFARQEITTKDDQPVASRQAFFDRTRPQLLDIMKKLKLFSRLALPPDQER